MDYSPAFPDFAAAFAPGRPALVWARWVADCETPVSAMLKVMREGEPSFLLESVHGGETRGRYSIIGLSPDILWRCRGNKAEMNTQGSLKDADFTPCPEPSIAALKKLVRASTFTIPEGLPPMIAGLIGYMGYDCVKLMETLPDENPDPIGLPDAMFMRPRVMAIFDAVAGELFVATPLWADHGFSDAGAAYDAMVARLAPVIEKLQAPLQVAAGDRPPLEGGQASHLASRVGSFASVRHGYSDKTQTYAKKLRKELTEMERKLWYQLRSKRFSNLRFRRQQPIGPYIADFYCSSARLIIEIDGGQHSADDAVAYDAKRTAFMENAGYRVLRFWNSDVAKNMDGVIQKIENIIQQQEKRTVNGPPLEEERLRRSEASVEAEGAKWIEPPHPLRQVPELPSLKGRAGNLAFSSNLTQTAYHGMVERAKEYIRAGDIFQVVPSQRFSAAFDLPPFALYRSLRHLNPSPFLFFLHFGDFSLVGSSPEILVRLRGGKVTVRPIAGTRKRGATPAEDKALEADLLADPKEISEHLMLLDLGRNDVGRVAKTGTVRVTERMAVERYSHVMHIVSNVEGDIASQYDAIDALIAGFPAGTVSGAPKIRAMEIIDELEPVRRSFYAGCVGYFSAGGGMDTCITLRTGLLKEGTLHVQAGGGVVADSDPEAEYQESRNKARALMRAAEEAWKFA
jgi:anthranilate/para-aminobenzoate synthase component I